MGRDGARPLLKWGVVMKGPQRKAVRLTGYDYATPGKYAITIRTYLSAPLLGHLVEGKIVLTDIGKFVSDCWPGLGEQYRGIRPGVFVVMPNHFHGLIEFVAEDESLRLSLPDIIRNFKAFTSHEYWIKSNQRKLWQRSYFEHIVRDAADLHRFENYIINNPSTWARDKYYLESEQTCLYQ